VKRGFIQSSPISNRLLVTHLYKRGNCPLPRSKRTNGPEFLNQNDGVYFTVTIFLCQCEKYPSTITVKIRRLEPRDLDGWYGVAMGSAASALGVRAGALPAGQFLVLLEVPRKNNHE
jgi:hypothetical protein